MLEKSTFRGVSYMYGVLWALCGTMVTFLITALGAANVFFINNTASEKLSGLFFALSSGIMLAASVWSLLLPAIDMLSYSSPIKAALTSFSFLLGSFFFIMADNICSKVFDLDSFDSASKSASKRSTLMLICALTIHNIPEGMSVGLAFALAAAKPWDQGLFSSAVCLAAGIAIQNYPEGAAVSLPLYSLGYKKRTAFCYGSLSALVEPLAGVTTALFASNISILLPFLLAFAAGTMVYVVIEELLPKCGFGIDTKKPYAFFAVGFLLMMFLDVGLG